MKKLFFPWIVLLLLVVMNSCTSSKQVAYFQNIDSMSLEKSKGLYDVRIMPKDMLAITVSTTDPAASRPFNLAVPNSTGSTINDGTSLLQYLVDNSGNINFPIIGKLHVQGLTVEECQNMICERVTPYMSKTENPIVTVRMASFRVTVFGEVGSPKVIPVTSEKMSVIEALAMAGDLSIHGKRKNILLIREDALGEKHHVRLDLTDAEIFNSPYYYVQQNDIIYVEPNSVKAKGASIGQSTSLWFSFVGIVTSVASLVVSIVRR